MLRSGGSINVSRAAISQCHNSLWRIYGPFSRVNPREIRAQIIPGHVLATNGNVKSVRPADALHSWEAPPKPLLMRYKLHIGVVLLVVAVFGFGAWLNLRQSEPAEGTSVGGMVLGVDIGGPFELTDQTGATFTDRDLAGEYALIYFGYTYCPDVCPTELGQMAAAIDELGADGARVRPVMITIDPQRDTPKVLAEYVPLFHERLVGLTGTEAEIRDVAKAYRVFFRKFEDPSYTDYLMDHTSFVYLLAPNGKVAGMFRYGTPPEDIAAAIRQHMRSNS